MATTPKKSNKTQSFSQVSSFVEFIEWVDKIKEKKYHFAVWGIKNGMWKLLCVAN